ncbi:hypothetical protein CC86DRAFT_420991 [Ophiobolus disseminans]|uniref:Xylanolytic transcriptional activator regulatory domain-containing protein n=1 Tax=Ophiobolus disseminans TaxID=1469910 RepID=A0A6A6ZU96_9PLEO|nr:hypothetical protein CC86DRAFT_420991 [Ophiobolus disseminans]
MFTPLSIFAPFSTAPLRLATLEPHALASKNAISAHSMSDQRENKRVRQACVNCRRKKTRCSGERPICRYNDSYISEFGGLPTDINLQLENAGLANRVALLETRLSLMDANGANGATLSSLFGSPSPGLQQGSGPEQFDIRPSSSDLTLLLDAETLQSLADVYFGCCHRQPYAFFHEETFRRNLENSSLPSYLLLTFAATAVRFSKEPCFAGRQAECTDAYARLAWSDLMIEAFSDSHNMDVRIVQAAAMLGIIDYIGGRDQLAWVKFGLAIRFAQTLQLGKEPSFLVPQNEAEERRQTFWSVYILDKLGSCGRNRPPTLLDSDCTSRLPLNEYALRLEPAVDGPTLEDIRDIPEKALLDSSDHFALAIFMVSAFGDVVKWAFKHGAADTRLPWDARSRFAHINGILTSFESYSEACDGNFAEIIDRDFVFEGTLNERAASHFSVAHVLYHTNQCLLHHPFLLRQHLKSSEVKAPVNFLRGALSKSQEHAIHLTAILHVLQQRGCKTYPSFYGYAAGLAGLVHRLHARNSTGTERWVAEANWSSCVHFLEQEPVLWESYRRISGVLKDFEPAVELATSLLSPCLDPIPLDSATEEYLWQVCDYAWLTNSARRLSITGDTSKPEVNPPFSTSPAVDFRASTHSPDFETLIEGALSFDFGLLSQTRSHQSMTGAYGG